MLSKWSRRAVYACAVGWIVLVAVYAAMALVSHPVLPAPYNVLIALLLATCTTAAAAARIAAYLGERLLTEAERRDGLLYAQADRVERQLRRLFTEESQHPHDTTAGHAQPVDERMDSYSRGYVDGLARRPMADHDAKVIPLARG